MFKKVGMIGKCRKKYNVGREVAPKRKETVE